MFSIERWQEVMETIRKNGLRTFLTGFSVFIGIFILVILLGVGEGMKNGIAKEFENDASNRISFYTGTTTKEYKGLNPGRRIQLTNDDYDRAINESDEEIEYKSGGNRLWSAAVSYKNETGNYRLEGVHPDYMPIENEELLAGRFINQNDLDNTSKVAVLGGRMKKDLFGEEDAVGKTILVKGINFKVVGVYFDPGGDREERRFYLPYTTASRVFNFGRDMNAMYFTLNSPEDYDKALEQSNRFSEKIEQRIRDKYNIAPDDTRAVRVGNSLEQAKKIFDMIFYIKAFFAFIGLGSLFAGIIGVSNIMIIIVKERTKEIGVRKALGAPPWNIIGMILHESVFITFLAGMIGLIAGLALLEYVGPSIDSDFISNPSIDFNIALISLGILIFAGGLAGFFPARRAAKIKPIVALRDE